MLAGAAEVLRRSLPFVLAVLVGLVGAWMGLRAFGQDTVRMGPFTVELSSVFGRGQTVVRLPPLGEVRLDTHDSPLSLRTTLIGVDLEELTERFGDGSTRRIVDAVEADARAHVRPFALRLLGVAAGGGLAAGLLVYRRRWRWAAASAAAALIVVGAGQAATAATFRTQAFAEPTFEGTLRLAPQLLGSVEEVSERLDAFRVNLARIVNGAVRAYSALEPQTIGAGDELRVLHISDVHLNTVGLDFAVELARGFDVDLVLDTGDLTSYGTPVEEAIVTQIPRFGRPYVFVRGNHDPPAVGEQMAAVANGVVLEGNMTTVEGLRIYGLAHPVFTEDHAHEREEGALAEGARAANDHIRGDIEELDVAPDVLAVHDDRMAEELAGRVPLVLSGHYHRARARSTDGTLFLRAGSAGGAGVNMFENGNPVPLSATILYFERGDQTRLLAYDIVEQSPTTGRLTIQRRMVADIHAAPIP